ncbi:MAG: phosphotransferase [Candidatus Eisenbacteria sp.]|nr:phosphotransferase [Candidatus Eisenbacteria bacterium]
MDALQGQEGLRRFLSRAMPLLAGSVQAPLASSRPAADPPASSQPAADSAAPNQAVENDLTLTRLAGDGSSRQIFRVKHHGVAAIAIANPLPRRRSHPDENEGFFAVREHLQQRGVRVPRFYAADLKRGFFLIEDMGDTRLYDIAHVDPLDITRRDRLYEEAIDLLVRMQSLGSQAFRPEETGNPAYTEPFIVRHEAAYFHKELVLGLARFHLSFTEIEEECLCLARAALPLSLGQDAGGRQQESAVRPRELDGLVFMHRDFQSRNLMVTGSTVAVIDFQGARLGPPEYDLASLLLDPYVELPDPLWQRLQTRYLLGAARGGIPGIPTTLGDGVDAQQQRLNGEWGDWHRRFLANGANRLMQALGAFAKLGGRLNRPGFLEYIPAGLTRLESVLQQGGDCPGLLALTRRLLKQKGHWS